MLKDLFFHSRQKRKQHIEKNFSLGYQMQRGYVQVEPIFQTAHLFKKRLSLHTSQVDIRPDLIPVSVAWSDWECFYSPPGWDASPPQGYPQH